MRRGVASAPCLIKPQLNLTNCVFIFLTHLPPPANERQNYWKMPCLPQYALRQIQRGAANCALYRIFCILSDFSAGFSGLCVRSARISSSLRLSDLAKTAVGIGRFRPRRRPITRLARGTSRSSIWRATTPSLLPCGIIPIWIWNEIKPACITSPRSISNELDSAAILNESPVRAENSSSNCLPPIDRSGRATGYAAQSLSRSSFRAASGWLFAMTATNRCSSIMSGWKLARNGGRKTTTRSTS